MYPFLLKAHPLLLVVSLLSFALRTFWAIKGSDKIYNEMLFKIHKVLNVVLILSGFALCVAIGQYPFIDAWVTEKFILLFVYVAFAMLASKPEMNLKIRKVFITMTVVFFVVMNYVINAIIDYTIIVLVYYC
ncbi:MAG: putative membrane protein SirB2 [Moritella sp.]|jgi:uncharacterized membrane protein SirB2